MKSSLSRNALIGEERERRRRREGHVTGKTSGDRYYVAAEGLYIRRSAAKNARSHILLSLSG